VIHSLYYHGHCMLFQLRKHWPRNSARPSLNCVNSKVYLLINVVLCKRVCLGLLAHGVRPVIISPFEAFCKACSLYLSSAAFVSALIISISLNHLLYNAILNFGTKEFT
jgi:hypothetical protein